MGTPTGFLQFHRSTLPERPVAERIADSRHVYGAFAADELGRQAARCMDCGIPFCHHGCPLGNHIPDWNDLAYREQWRAAIARLHGTNDFPEFTGLLCPAPCEGACVLGLADQPVTIKSIELAIVDRAFEEGWITPAPPAVRTWKRVAVVGSGPAGLAAASQLNRAGHSVTVFERADRIGGLLRYGIPDFKLEKRVLDRRLALLAAEGVMFQVNVDVGRDLTTRELRRHFDAVLLACGATQPRDLPVPGRKHSGIHFAMDYLTAQNRRVAGDAHVASDLDAAGKDVVIVGGGDTGADCLGTAHRQGARSVTQLERLPAPPSQRAPDNPWPLWPQVWRDSSAHVEGGTRLFATETHEFEGSADGRVQKVCGRRVDTGEAVELRADLVLLAMGFTGAAPHPLLEELAVRVTERQTVWCDDTSMTSTPGVFVAGDVQRGQSLVVWAIADGRRAATAIDAYLRRGAS